MRCEM